MLELYKTLKDFEMVLKEAGCKLVVIDFSAKWCGPCQTIKPRFHELAAKSVISCEVDVDDAPDLAEWCQISCMPTFHFYKNGKRVFEFSGANRTTLEDKIRELQ
ncbi:thioredoxin-like [Cetorhinus maximus]